MKKLRYPSLFIFLVLITLNINQNKSKNIADLTLSNIEAIASTELTNCDCLYQGSLDCPNSKSKVRVIYYN